MVDWEGAFASHSALKAHLPYEPFPLQNGPFTNAQRRIVIEKNLETWSDVRTSMRECVILHEC